MQPIDILRALSRSAPALTGNHPDAATLADQLGLADHADCYNLMDSVLAAGWARVTNRKASEWDQWTITARGQKALASN